MRLTLINPNFQRRVRRVAQTTVGPPLGLAYLAASARQAGHEVDILDANALGLGLEDTVERALRGGPGVVGVTATTATVCLAGELAAAVKARRPEVVTVVGGPHTTFMAERTLREFPGIDFAARGEAELSLVDLLDALGSEGRTSLRSVQGFAFRNEDGSIVDTGHPRAADDLDGLPRPARDLLPMERYRCTDSDSFTTILAMRGCPYTCVYCAVPGMFDRRMRYRSPSKIAEEMDEVNARFGVEFFGFVDDTFTTRASWVLELCDELERRGLNRRVRWNCLTRPDLVEPELLARMRRAGCVRVEMSIETGSEHGRRALKKGLTEETVLRGFREARKAGLSTMGFAILNIPGESPADMDRTLELARRVDPDYLQVSFLTPYPGTPLRDQAEREGRITTDDWSRYGFLRDVVLRNDHLTADEIRLKYQRFVRAFYFRPRTAWKLARLVLNGTTRVRPLTRTVALGLAGVLFDRGAEKAR